MFEEEVRAAPAAGALAPQSRSVAIMAIEPQVLAPSLGVEIGRDLPANYTAAADAHLQYTDLRNAYTSDSTFSGQVADVHYEERTFGDYQAERKAAPRPLQNDELRAVAEAEQLAVARESQRIRRAAEHDRQAEDYFTRITRLIVTDEKPLSITDRET